MEKRLNISKKMMGEDIAPINNICTNCGSHFMTYRYSKSFCSKKCDEEHRIKTARCAHCGKRLAEIGVEIDLTKRIHFCNEECESEYRLQRAIENGLKKNCLQCGEEFIANRKGQKYCSKECSRQHMKEHPVKNKTVFVDKYVTCIVCKKQVMVRLPKEDALDPTYRYICSDRCRNIKAEYYIKREAEQKKQNKEDAKKEYLKNNGICPTCKTPYGKCVKMTSKFKNIPEGAVVENGVIVKCPSFKG